ncbi:complex I subunit 5 family protein [Natranaerobius trueperi]|uniref:NADH dehydrogenase subunit n=1 Tax=Natranaerobius trueperi TaxID=759412 RepID=A0A226BYA5_9FIRM|nr:proton-conducting transporter membrane subunit [Natranaerobius trueperi]OWZ83911.1 NADH dehydrogenase subunit [Natranaerobius trueperi]
MIDTEENIIKSIIPMLIVLIPLIGSFGVLVLGRFSEKIRDISSVLLSFTPLMLAVRLYPLIQQGVLEYRLDWFLDIGIIFRVDQFSYLFIVLISLIWFLATLYATNYISYEHNRTRFYFFWIVTYASTLGVFATGDLFGLFLFFEAMSITSYVLVIHEEDQDAMRAGNLFLFLGIGGGLFILFGLFILYFRVETLEIIPILGDLSASDVNIPIVALLFIIGFGIKAGMVPLHIWLPKAHPVAPTPASAILSGLMIKTGVYGMWRVFLMIMGPTNTEELEFYFNNVANWGMGLFWIGIVTMFLGALMALLQTSAKKMLAYSSVSQIGFVILSLGSAIYLGDEGIYGFAGGLFHIINHALFKACLFLIVGAIFIKTHLLDINRVRGMFKQMPYMGVSFIIAALGIAGIPLFNGYASKTMVHKALTDVYYLHPNIAMFIADKIFVLTSALTLSYFIKLFRGLFLGPLPDEWKSTDISVAPIIKVIITVFLIFIVAIGVFPNVVLETFIIPAFETFPYETEMVQEQLQGINLFTTKDLSKTLIVVLIAVAITVTGEKLNSFNYQPPKWLSIEALIYKPFISGFLSTIERLGTTFDVSVSDFYESTGAGSLQLCRKIGELDKNLTNAYDKSSKGAKNIAEKTSRLDETFDEMYDSSGGKARELCEKARNLDRKLSDGDNKLVKKFRLVSIRGTKENVNHEFEQELERAYLRSGRVSHYAKRRKKNTSFLSKLNFDPSKINIKNLNFDSFIIALMLGLLLLILVFYNQIFR